VVLLYYAVTTSNKATALERGWISDTFEFVGGAAGARRTWRERMTMSWQSLYALVLLIAANSTPWVVGKLSGGRAAWSMDAGKVAWDGERWLGSHKTWRGFMAGVVASAMVSELWTGNVGTGAGFGALSLLGDALSSCLKRRFHRDPGAEVPIIDQLPECVLPLLVYAPQFGLTLYDVLGITLAFSIAGIALTRIRAVMFTLLARRS
jgi:hypothetical protein